MPKQIINTKMNMQNIIILSIFVIGCLILYRMISTVQQQVLVLKNDVETMKLQHEERANNTINSFCAVAKDEEDDIVSVNSEQINNIMNKLNGSSDSLESSVIAQNIIDSIMDDDNGIDEKPEDDNANAKVSKDMMFDETTKEQKNAETFDDSDDDIKIIRTSEQKKYDEEELATKQLSELKTILKSITGKPVKGNKNEILKKILELQ